jgi:miniconductance mechanosensitive channel
MSNFLESWLRGLGLETGLATILAIVQLLIISAMAVIANLIAKRVLLRIVVGLVSHTDTGWDDAVVDQRVFHRLARIAPALVIYSLTPAALGVSSTATTLVTAACLVYMIVVVVSVLDGVLNAVVGLVGASRFGVGLPLTAFAQVAKLVLYGVAIIVALSVVIGRSPALLFSGLGAMTAVLMLIFKDPILGFMAGIQLSANKMARVGDWIEMPKYGADGDVLEVALTTVKIQNFDKTITTIPTYALISESFKNWRGMAESEGRRIKRAIAIDISSIRFCDDAMLVRLSKIHYMAEYLEEKQQEMASWSQQHAAVPTTTLHPRRLTNIGTFRAYAMAYLRHHPKIHQQMTFLVRQLAPTEHGLPLEIYVFSNDQNWENYEAVQSDIFDHLLAVMSEFELRVYQVL